MIPMSEKTTTIQAPAKINLSLRVIGKRADGFHEIDTLMTRVEGLYDTLIFTEAKKFSFHCEVPGVPTDESNLVVKAVRAFEKASKKKCKIAIELQKNIPHGAGLGGGSSDAAATLKALNEWHDAPLNEEQLAQLAATLGSDIPFFFGPGTARCTGRGEILTPVTDLPKLQVVILKPSFSVSTADAYGRWKTAVELPGIAYEAQNFPWGPLMNDLEKPVFGKFVFLAELKHWLRSRPEVTGALMTGSGSAMIALVTDAAAAELLIQQVRERLDPVIWAWSGEIGV
jgi:4-diphosphocytidyl-2-C-methyl-D-erythritol kinase